jgi:hypothetical protein
MHTIFRVEEINQMDNGIYHVHLTMTYEDDEQLRELTNYFEKVLISKGFSQLMIELGEYSKALQICQTMSPEISERNNRKMGWRYFSMNDLDVFKQHFEIAVDLATAENPLLVSYLCRICL